MLTGQGGGRAGTRTSFFAGLLCSRLALSMPFYTIWCWRSFRSWGDRGAVRDALRVIGREDPGLALRMQLPPDKASRTDEFRSALGDWLETKSFQGAQKVIAALSYVGSSLTWHELQAEAGADAPARLDHFTQMRHDIVHRGRSPRIVRNGAQECIDVISAVAAAINANVVSYYHQ